MKIDGADGVDRALARLASLEGRQKRAEAFREELVAKVKTRVARVLSPIKLEFRRLKEQLSRWTFRHQDSLEGRTLNLTHGAVMLRKTPDAIISDLTDDEIVLALERNGFEHMVRTKKEPDRVAMKELTDAQLKLVHCTRDSQDEFKWRFAGETEWR